MQQQTPGGEGTQQHFKREGSALRSNPLPFHRPFLIEMHGTPFVYLHLNNGTPCKHLLMTLMDDSAGEHEALPETFNK